MTMYKVNNKLKNPSKMLTEQMYCIVHGCDVTCPPMICPNLAPGVTTGRMKSISRQQQQQQHLHRTNQMSAGKAILVA